MSDTNPKPRGKSDGQPLSEVTRFQVLWSTSLSEDARDFWRERFASADTQAQIRAQLFAKLKVNLRNDVQLTRFRKWLAREDIAAEQAERMERNRARIQSAHPGWSLDDVLEEVMKVSAEEALASGDYKLGLATVDRDSSRKRTSLESRRITLLEKKAAAYDRAQELLTKAKSSKGGFTKETLHKIEQELNLL